jgi:hypothetical protein
MQQCTIAPVSSEPTAQHQHMASALCLQARKLEGELDVKLASYGKLCSGFEAGGKGPGSAAAADQVCRQVNRDRIARPTLHDGTSKLMCHI